jgi:hypothetical protein
LLIFLPIAGWTQQRGAPETATRSLTKPQPKLPEDFIERFSE